MMSQPNCIEVILLQLLLLILLLLLLVVVLLLLMLLLVPWLLLHLVAVNKCYSEAPEDYH